METLPLEMLERITCFLTPQDLASCCSVCVTWRDIFNQDLLWKPHCDPALVEPLDTTPCVVDPVFVSPENNTSTLTPISYWRLTYLKQAHLWNNWKNGRFKKTQCLRLEHSWWLPAFLSDTLVVNWSTARIEIWDVSTTPEKLVSTKNFSGSYAADYCNVFGTSGLIINKNGSVKIFHVDSFNNHAIELKYSIRLRSFACHYNFCYAKSRNAYMKNLVKESVYICIDKIGRYLFLTDLDKRITNKISCPVVSDKFREQEIYCIKGFQNSDNVIVGVFRKREKCQYYYIYSLRKLVFLSGPTRIKNMIMDSTTIHGDYLAVTDSGSLKVYNCLTSECIFTTSVPTRMCIDFFKNNFILFGVSNSKQDEVLVFVYSLSDNMLKIVCKYQDSYNGDPFIKIVNNRFVITCKKCPSYVIDYSVSYETCVVWEASGPSLKRSDIPATNFPGNANQAFTRGFKWDDYAIYYYW